MKLKKYYVTSDLITSRFRAVVLAKSKKEAIEKFEEGETEEMREDAECEQINIEVKKYAE